jgi:hypothetical protein
MNTGKDLGVQEMDGLTNIFTIHFRNGQDI